VNSLLISILQDIVRAEYAQWMRYTYLSTLPYGMDTDTVHEHFGEHAGEELGHAAVISRWIVDLGALPPTEMRPVEQFQGSLEEALEWLLQAEIDGINKYQIAHEAAEGIFGLQNDIDDNLSAEHEHLSDIMNFLEPVTQAAETDEDEDVIIVIASNYRKFVASGGFKRFASTQKQANNFSGFLRDVLEMAWFKYEYDYTPQKGLEYAREDAKKTLTNIHERLVGGDQSARDSAQFFIGLYKWLVSPQTERGWLQIHYSIWPEYHLDPAWQDPEAEQEQKQVEQKAKPSFEQVMTETEQELKKTPAAPAQPAPAAPQPQQTPSKRSPELMQALEKRIEVYDAGKSNDPNAEVMFAAGPGDRVKNMDLAGEGIPPPGRPGRSGWTEGVIKEITREGVIVVETPKGIQQWDPNADRIEIDMKDRSKYIGQGKLLKQS
jgi:bacterioferritin (cytochrome b1)